jgi:PIN domain nuclease of toxin-antitoxin system
MLNLDTHILIYALSGDLRSRERKLLSSQRWNISAIVLWELAKLSQLKRIELDFEDVEVRRALSRSTFGLSLTMFADRFVIWTSGAILRMSSLQQRALFITFHF